MAKPSPSLSMETAIAAAGSQSGLAKIVGRPVTTVNSWYTRGNDLPAEHVLSVEAATGVSRHDLRPDLYPREESPARPPAGEEPALAGGSSSATLEDVRR